ncbi:MAG: arginase family protein [Acidobacteriota bacterium]
MTDRYLLSPFFLDEPVPELESLAEPGWSVIRPPLPETTTQGRMSAIHRPLADRVTEILEGGERPIAVVGDCCASIPVAAGLERAGVEPVLVWLDAHGDFNTWETTPSGFLGGMPLAMLVGRGDGTLMDQVMRGIIPEDRVVLTDARDLDPAERTLLEDTKVNHLPDARSLLSHSLPEGPLWVHYDIDIIDPTDAPAVLYPAPGGRRAEDLELIFRELARLRQIVAISFSTWNPKLDSDGTTREVGFRLLRALAGS